MKQLHSSNLRSVSGGLFFVAATIYFILSVSPIENFNVNSLWTILMIFPAIISMLVLGIGFFNSILFYTGIGLFLYQNGIINNNNAINMIITLSIMTVGLIITGSIGKISPEDSVLRMKKNHIDQNEFNKSSAIISSNTANFAKAITSGNLKSSFCTSAYDISEGIIKNEAEFNLSAKFGNLIFVIPDNYKILLNSSSSFGRIINKAKIDQNASATVKINAKATFGKVIIRNK